MADCYSPIGVFDSGVGGISVLNSLRALMPNENYIFIGDSANAPYGTKPEDEVFRLSENSLLKLLDSDAKQIVIACNTATAVCADKLREKYHDIQIVGIEPAIKPAATENPGRNVAVLATNLTVHQKRIEKLYHEYSGVAHIELVPCIGLVEFIESGHLYDEKLFSYLEVLLKPYKKFDAFVLGCTHYPLIKEAFHHVLGADAKLYDGGEGTARRAKSLLEKSDMLNPGKEKGSVEIINTMNSDDMISLSESLII